MQQNIQDQYPPQPAGQPPIPMQAPYGAPYGQYPVQAPYGPPPPYGQQPAYGQQMPYGGPMPMQQQPYYQGQPNPNGGAYSYQNYTAPAAGALHNNQSGYFDDIPADKLLTGDLDIAIRNGFVRKVYGILSLQLLITFGMATCFNVWPAAAQWLYRNYFLLIIAAVAMLASVCTLTCVPKVARRAPTNYILLGVIAVCMGIVLGYSTGAVDSAAFAIAAGMTAAVTIAVSLFACQTKYDFTGCGVYAFVGLIILMIFGIVTMFWRNKIAHLVYASLGAALFSFYLIIDTQMIVGGKHRAYQFSIDDYCFAALTLYMDIINLFMYILQIVAAARND